MCRIFIIFILQLIVYPFRIVEDIRTTEECTAGPSVITAVVDLIRYIVDGPVCLFFQHPVRAQSGNHKASVAVIYPIVNKREKVIMQVIHHRDDHILLPVLHPHFRILEDTFISRPSGVRNTFDAVILAERRTADLYPRLYRFHPVINAVNHLIDILPAPFCQRAFLTIFIIQVFIRERFCLFRIADIIEMDAVDIVSVHQLLH